MSQFIDFQNEALDEAMDLLGSPFVYNGATYQGIISAVKLSSKLRDGGFLEDVETIIIARVGDFAAAPIEGERITIEGRAVRIDTISKDETSYEIRCITAAK